MRRFILFATLFSLTGLVSAETFHGSFEMDGRGGSGKVRIRFIYNLDLSNKQNIIGDVSVTGGQTNCNRDYKLTSGSIKDGAVILISESLDGHCGPYIFKGKMDGSNMIGAIPMRGQPREITLQPS